MKSYNHLYEQFISDENYYQAIRNATQNKGGKKKKRASSLYYRNHKEELKSQILDYAKHFYNFPHEPKEIYDGIRRKKRTILVPTMPEQVVHHMVVNVLKPIIMKPMYYHSYGSLPKRGAIGNRKKGSRGGKQAIWRFIRRHPDQCAYYLKIDIKKFFENISHNILKQQFARIIHDAHFLNIIYTIIDAVPGDRGIPIGFYTSQWFANFYLIGLDHYIAEQLGAPAYYRFMDDMVIFSSDKAFLHDTKNLIENYLGAQLELEVNPKWRVQHFTDCCYTGCFLDFMGFRFYPNKITLRRNLMMRLCRKARRIFKKIHITIYDCRQMLSYKGWLIQTNCFKLYKTKIEPYISFPRLQRLMGEAQRRINNVVSKLEWKRGQTCCA